VAQNQTANYSASAQTVALAATVTSSTATVNEGTVTFTVWDGAVGTGTVIGTATTSGTVSGGNASVNYTLPAATAAKVYTIQAVYNPGTDFQTSSDTSHTLTVVPPPTVTSVSPVGGPLGGGNTVTINGTGFQSGATVTFGTVAATNVTFVTALKLTATAPANPAGAVNVVVTNPDTQTGTLTNGYLYAAAPTVTSVSPVGGPTAGGTAVTIAGTGFQSGATVTFGTVAATNVTFVTALKLTATAPANPAGAVNVVVTNPDTQTGTLTNGYTYCALSIVPTSNLNVLADDGTAGTVFSIAVTATADAACAWSAAATSSGGPNLPWLNIQSGAGPTTGDGTVTYTVTNNIGALATASRNGNIAFSYAGVVTNYGATQAVVAVSAVSPASSTEHVTGSSPAVTIPFSATVTGAHNTTIDWSTSGTYCNNLSCINSGTGLYTVPTFLTVASATDTITATAAVDITKSQQATVTILDNPPACTLSVSPPSQSYSLPFTATVSCSEAQTDMASVSTNWGDCANNPAACVNGATFSPTTNTFTSSPTHIYIVPSAGANNPTIPYGVTTTATSSGGLTGSAAVSVVAINNPPVCQAPVIQQVVVNNTTTNVTVLATCTDIEPDIATVSINWGDGSASTSCSFTNQSTASCTPTHSYAAAANGASFTITVSAVDNFPAIDGTSNPATDLSMATLTQLPTDPTAPTAIGGPSSGPVNAVPTVALTANNALTPECSAITNASTATPYVNNTLGINCSFDPTGPIAQGGAFVLTLSINGPAPSTGGNARTATRLTSLSSLWLGFPAIVFVGVGASLLGSPRALRRRRAAASGLLLSVLLLGLLVACGGGFAVPPQPKLPQADNLTPVGTYYVTVIGTESNNNVQTTVQTWVVPLNVP
jgi:hypothetical protein